MNSVHMDLSNFALVMITIRQEASRPDSSAT